MSELSSSPLAGGELTGRSSSAVLEVGERGRYVFCAWDRAQGKEIRGERDGSDAAEIRAHLRRMGWDILTLERVDVPAPRSGRRSQALRRWWVTRERRGRSLVKADLLDAVATLLDAGVPLEQALHTLAMGRSRSSSEAVLLNRLCDAIREGVTPADAFAGIPGWFDRLDVALVAASQHTGDLAGTLRELSQFHHRAGAIGQQISAALIYPLILVVAGIAVWEFLSLKTLPPLMALIIQGHREPPFLTVMVASAGRWFAVGWPLIIAAAFLAGWSLRQWLRRIPIEASWARWRFTNPWSRIQLQARCAQVAHALARLLKAGTPLPEGLEVVAEIATDERLAQLLRDAAETVRAGGDFSALVAQSPLLDQEFAQVLQLGEQSGELPTLLVRVADRYQRGAERAVERFTALAGPAAIILVACLIGLIVMAAVLPLVQLGDLV